MSSFKYIHTMETQIMLIALVIWLMITSRVAARKKYTGPDAIYYEPYDRRIIPGLHQQLLSYQNVAFVYGVYGFDIPCERYNWMVFDGHSYDERPCNCQVIGRGVYRFDDLRPCTMNLVYLDPATVPAIPWESYRTPLYLKTQCDQPLEPVRSHFIVSTGPGWVVLRFPIVKSFMYMAAYRLVYRKIGDSKWVKTRLHEYIVWGRIMPRVKPLIPCPPWRDYSMFCLMVTDHIRVVDVPYNVYEGQIQGIGLISAEEYDFRFSNYKFVFRVFNCDVFTEGKCPPAFGHWTPDPLKATMSDLDYLQMVEGQPWTLRPLNKEELTRKKKKPLTDEDFSLLVLGAFLVFLILLLLFFAIFCCAKRRARDRALYNWYFISADTWPVNYTLRLPPNLPRSDQAAGARGEADRVYMDVISQRPVIGLATKHRTRPEGEAADKEGGGDRGGDSGKARK